MKSDIQIHHILIFLLLTIPSIDLSAQQKFTDHRVSQLIEKADQYIERQSLDSASTILRLVSSHLLLNGDTIGYLNSLKKRSEVFQRNVQYDSSFQIAQFGLGKMKEFHFQDPILKAEFLRRQGLILEIRDGDLDAAANTYKLGLSALNALGRESYINIDLNKDLAVILLSKGMFDSTSIALDKIITKQKNYFPDQHIELADTYRLKALGLTLSNSKDSAIIYYEKARLSLSRADSSKRVNLGMADIIGNIANLHHLSGYYDSALFYYEKQKIINEKTLSESHNSLQKLYASLTGLHQFKGNYDSATYYAYKSLSIAQKTLDPNHPDLAVAFKNIASCFFNEGKLQDAKVYYLKSLEIIKSTYGMSHWETADVLSNLGVINIELGNFNTAINQLTQAINIENDEEFKYVDLRIRNHLYLIDAYLKIQQMDKVEDLLTKASVLVDNIDNNTHQSKAELESRFGQFYSQIKAYEKALESFDLAVQIFKINYGPKHPSITHILNQIAELKIGLLKPREAKTLLLEAIEANTYTLEVNSFPEYIKVEDFINPLIGIESLSILAQAEKEIFDLTQNKSSLKYSLNRYERLFQLLAILLLEASEEDDIIRTVELFHNNYNSAISLIHEMREEDLLDHNEYLAKYLEYSESSRGIVSKYFRFRHKSYNALRHDPNKVDSLRLLRREIAFTKSQIATLMDVENSVNTRNYYQNKLFEFTRTKNRLSNEIQAEEIAYDSFLEARSQDHLTEYQSKMGTSEALIEYYLVDEKLFSLLIKKDSVLLKVQRVGPSLYTYIEQHASIRNDKVKQFSKGSHELYKLLIHPFKEYLIDVTQLTILPEKELWSVNFGLLLQKPVEVNDYKKWSFLMKAYQISYAYTIHSLNEKSNSISNNQNILAIANNGTFNINQSALSAPFMKLRGTLSEVKALEGILKGKFLYGNGATENYFKKKSTEYSILHLALHGVSNNATINSSYLVFPTDSTELSDGRLYPFEVTELDLNVSLAVLSACETGVGKIVNGEGTMSFGRAFLNAGVQGLLLTQWQLSDAIAPEIISRFYKNLESGLNKAESLRLAQLEFLESANNITANPYYWGSFFILGDTSPVPLKPKTNPWYILMGFLGIFIVLIVLRVPFKRVFYSANFLRSSRED